MPWKSILVSMKLSVHVKQGQALFEPRTYTYIHTYMGVTKTKTPFTHAKKIGNEN